MNKPKIIQTNKHNLEWCKLCHLRLVTVPKLCGFKCFSAIIRNQHFGMKNSGAHLIRAAKFSTGSCYRFMHRPEKINRKCSVERMMRFITLNKFDCNDTNDWNGVCDKVVLLLSWRAFGKADEWNNRLLLVSENPKVPSEKKWWSKRFRLNHWASAQCVKDYNVIRARRELSQCSCNKGQAKSDDDEEERKSVSHAFSVNNTTNRISCA